MKLVPTKKRRCFHQRSWVIQIEKCRPTMQGIGSLAVNR